ncbi:hypothetical protein ADK57_25665 [Streptomyces sp. MMG1533]|uniref:hypothetical protein n=1 Tax=Streptomyces sp. MMG1533 TaxID=1415546 RepID=UPI0006AE118F|nr:hypothetical protein [Streptomyces sp. MMG1533]KOU62033.1 hypothetical protein ADK57_25665 [Streptomyces sp. MMG1533]
MKIFGRDPVLFLNSLSAILGLVVTFNVGLTENQAGWIVAGMSAILGAVAAALTRPIAPQAFTTLVATVASAVAAFGYDVAPTTTAAINGLVLAIIMFITRGQVSPASPTAPASQPAKPVL